MPNAPIAPCLKGSIELARYVLLDTGVVGLCYSTPNSADAQACLAWIRRLEADGAFVLIPEIVRYEASRELIRRQASLQLRRLDTLCRDLLMVPVNLAAWDQAARFWALVRQAGQPTAAPEALDADAILAAVAVTIAQPGDSATIATTNVRHLTRFPGIDARLWTQIG